MTALKKTSGLNLEGAVEVNRTMTLAPNPAIRKEFGNG
jgi:hypothetical protein